MLSSFLAFFLLLAAAELQRATLVSALPAPTGHNISNPNSSYVESPMRSRVFRTFKNLCTDTRKICNCAATDTGLINHEYAVLDVAGLPGNWEKLMEECLFEGYLNNDGLTYR